MSWEDKVRRVVPYTPGEQPQGNDIIKLNTNECPYPPSPKVAEAVQSFHVENLRLYPDPEAAVLEKCLARYHEVEQEQVFAGVGSDDVLAMAFQTFFNSGRPILFPDITYSFYEVWAGLFGIPYRCPGLDSDFHTNAEDYRQENGGIVLANPNAPTGLGESLAVIEDIIKANPEVVVIVDEAYVDFGGESALSLLPRYDNLLVVRTFSKSRAMAGIRIGYGIGNKKLISYLKDVKFSFNSYTMNRPSLEWGVASIQDDAYFKTITGKITETRELTKRRLTRLGFVFPDSQANFIFASHKRIPAAELFAALRKEGIYVRYFDRPRISNYLRITIGTPEQMDRLIGFLTEYIGKY